MQPNKIIPNIKNIAKIFLINDFLLSPFINSNAEMVKFKVHHMPACPDCHIFKGLWSELTEKEGVFVCKVNIAHRYKRDKDGNFHSVNK